MALTTNSPFNKRIINDPNYIVSSSVLVPTPSMDFLQAVPFPVTTERTQLTYTVVVTNALFSGSNSVTGSYFLQHSDDNVTFVNVTQKAAPLVTIQFASGSATISSSVLTSFEPDGKRYVRGSSSYSPGPILSGSGAGATGSYTLTVGF